MNGADTSLDADTIYKTSDGGFVFRNGMDQVTKLSSEGNIEWIKQYTSNPAALLRDVYPTLDGYVFSAQLFGGLLNDFWVFNVNSGGKPNSSVCIRAKDLPIVTLPSDFVLLDTPSARVVSLSIRNLAPNAAVLNYPATIRRCP